MNLPNRLTILRFILAAVFVALLSLRFPYAHTLALGVFVAASLTDWLDGHLARNVHGVSEFGTLMDPLADKILICAAFISFVELDILPAWMVVLIVSREFCVTGLRLLAANKGSVVSASMWGKLKTTMQMIAASLCLLVLALPDFGTGALVEEWHLNSICLGVVSVAVLVTVISGVYYYNQLRHHLDSN